MASLPSSLSLSLSLSTHVYENSCYVLCMYNWLLVQIVHLITCSERGQTPLSLAIQQRQPEPITTLQITRAIIEHEQNTAYVICNSLEVTQVLQCRTTYGHTYIHTYIHGHVVNIIRTNLVWNVDSMIKIAVATFSANNKRVGNTQTRQVHYNNDDNSHNNIKIIFGTKWERIETRTALGIITHAHTNGILAIEIRSIL